MSSNKVNGGYKVKSYFGKKSASLKSSFLVGGRWSTYNSFFCFGCQQNLLKDHCWLEAELRFDLCFNLIASGQDAIRAITMFCISFWSSRFGSGLYLPLIYPWMVWRVTLLHASSWLWYYEYALLTVEILWHRSDPSFGSRAKRRRTTTFGKIHLSIWRICSMLHHGWPLLNRWDKLVPGLLQWIWIYGTFPAARSRRAGWKNCRKKNQRCVS